MSESSTRDRILDAAEMLYAEHGIDATSLRAITASAGVNLAAVNYHFGSKRGLTEQVFERRILPLTRERLRLLGDLEESAAPGCPRAEDVIRAFVLPALRLTRDPTAGGERVVRLIGRIYSEPAGEIGPLLAKQFYETFHRFSAALGRAVPELPPAELFWRFHFIVGALIHTVSDPARICRLTDGSCELDDVQEVTERLVHFLAAGLRAPLPDPAGPPVGADVTGKNEEAPRKA